MADVVPPPWRSQFDQARDPYSARNALGLTSTGGGGGGAPTGAEYITAATDPTLTAERVLTDTATVTWDFSTPGQAKASTAAGGGNVSNSGTPAANQYARWVTSTTIQGVSAATVLSDISAQPLDADLTAIAALTGTNTIYYRSAANVWSAITVNAGLTFTGGVLDRAALTGDVTAPANSAATTIASDAVTYAKMQNVSAASLLIGRGSAAGAGDPQEITLGTNLAMSGTTLNATGGSGSGFATVVVQTFTASGTYTPTASMKYCTIECVGGGGGGGGVGDSTGIAWTTGGGGSGGYSRKTVSAATVGASQTVTIGAAGNAGTAAGANGGAGGATSVGTLCVANGGSGGSGHSPASSWPGGAGGVIAGAAGDVIAAGNPGESGVSQNQGSISSSNGGASYFGGGGRGGQASSGASAVGGAASNYGAGGGAAYGCAVATTRAGGAGSAGFVIITEYI